MECPTVRISAHDELVPSKQSYTIQVTDCPASKIRRRFILGLHKGGNCTENHSCKSQFGDLQLSKAALHL